MNAVKVDTVGPVALVCATACFLSMVAAYVLLVVYASEQADAYLRPLIPTFAALGSGALLWFRARQSSITNSQENSAIAGQVSTAAEVAIVAVDKASEVAGMAASKADSIANTLETRLNGEFDARLEKVVAKVLAAQANPNARVELIDEPNKTGE